MTDLLLVCLGATAGLRAADDALAASLERAGATTVRVTAAPPREVRTLMATDLTWALAARRAAVTGIAEHAPRAILYSTTTAALLWPRPGAIRLDAPAADTRPGRHGLWQRPLEARRFAQASVLVPWTAVEAGRTSASGAHAARTVVVPMPVGPSGPAAAVRDIAALTYGANWRKKGLDRVLAAWARTCAQLTCPEQVDRAHGPSEKHSGAELVVAGVESAHVADAWAAGGGTGPLPDSVRVTGPLAPAAYRALLRRARVFVTAPRREDYGIAQLEALADGCLLVTSAAPGPYAALPLARALDPRLVVEDGTQVETLAAALRSALGDGGPARGARESYAARAAAALTPFSPDAVDTVVARELLPRLLA